MTTSTPASTLSVQLSDPGLATRTVTVDASADMVAWLCANGGDYTTAFVTPDGERSVRYTRPLGRRDEWELASSFHDKAKAPKVGDTIKGRGEVVLSFTKRDEDSGAYFVKLDSGMLACLGEKTPEGWTFGGFR